MRSAYIWASAFFQVAVLLGGATFTFLTGNPWWVAGGLVLMFMASAGFSARLDEWRQDDNK